MVTLAFAPRATRRAQSIIARPALRTPGSPEIPAMRPSPLAFVPPVLALATAAALAAPPVAEAPHRVPTEAVNTPAGPALSPHPNAAAGLAMPYAGTPADVLSFHYDNARTGWNPTETALTVATVQSSKFGLLHTITVDGDVFAQPLLVHGLRLADGSMHDVLVVATSNNSVYAFDAQTYAQLWQVNLGPAQSSSDVGCGDVNPKYGIGSTPVVVRERGRAALFVVDAIEPTKNDFHTRVHALDMADGHDLRTPAEINPSATLSDGSQLTFDKKNQWVRSGLLVSGRSLWVNVGSHCDHNAGTISGWTLRYDTQLGVLSSFHTIETPAGTELASIWMSGYAAAVDTDGTVFAVTGNGNFAKGGKDWGESVLHLAADGTTLLDYFAPAAYRSLNNFDTDFGSGGVLLLPVLAGQSAPPMAVAMGKDATMYLLDRTKLGRESKNDAGALQAQRLASSGNGIWGGPAYWTSPAGGTVFYENANSNLKAFRLATGSTPSLTQFATGTTTSGNGGATPIVSSNGSQAGTGVVWVVRRSSPVTLEAYDAEALGAPIWSAQAGSWTAGRPFLTAMEADGRVYVGASGTVTVFGLTP
jgi:hypothetical protein